MKYADRIAKLTLEEKAGCPTCVLLLIDASIIAKKLPDGNMLSGSQIHSS